MSVASRQGPSRQQLARAVHHASRAGFRPPVAARRQVGGYEPYPAAHEPVTLDESEQLRMAGRRRPGQPIQEADYIVAGFRIPASRPPIAIGWINIRKLFNKVREERQAEAPMIIQTEASARIKRIHPSGGARAATGVRFRRALPASGRFPAPPGRAGPRPGERTATRCRSAARLFPTTGHLS